MRNPKFLGVYSLRTASANGQKPKFFVWLLPDGNYAIQELDASLSQRGPARGISSAGLEKAFKAEPSILAAPITTPDFRPLMPTPRQPQPRQADGAAPLESAAKTEPEEDSHNAIRMEAVLRENFARALSAVKRPKDKDGALTLMERIIRTQQGIEPVHKHMFRDFGVALRKRSLLKLALLSAQRAVILAPRDDHARFNLARILGMLGRYQEAEAQLATARRLDPNETVYDRLASYLEKERTRTERPTLDGDD